MSAILRIRDENGNETIIPAIKGDKGDKGDPGQNGEDGKDGKDGATVAEVIAAQKTEEWVFTLRSDGSQVTKKVVLAE